MQKKKSQVSSNITSSEHPRAEHNIGWKVTKVP